MHLIKWRQIPRILHVRCSDPSWLRLVQSSFQQFSRVLTWTVPSYDIPFAFDHPQSRTCSTDNFVRIFFTYNRMKIMCAEHAPFIYGKDIARKGLVSVQTEATEDEEKWYGLTIHPTSMTALWRMFVNYNSRVREGGNRIPGWDFEFPRGDLEHGEVREKGSGSMSLWYFKRMPAAQLWNDVMKM